MKIAIMQPYFFPYIGYFQLAQAVDTFVFYDDVNFIKRGWINRNRILLNGMEHLITIPCVKVSQNKLINEVEVDYDHPDLLKLPKKLLQAYHNAPNRDVVVGMVNDLLRSRAATIAEMAAMSVQSVYNFLGIDKKFKMASLEDYDNKQLEKADRLIDIVTKEGSISYVNAIGGSEIYSKEYFEEKGIKLEFLKPEISPYPQMVNEFIPGLSVLDMLMMESKENIRSHFNNYRLV
jgi:hypothetical protein